MSSEENTPLDLDDHGGRTFLRVLLHLTMHDYPPLVSRALQLLFRHFSQRQEVLQAFKQVPPNSCYTFRWRKAVDAALVPKLGGRRDLNPESSLTVCRLYIHRCSCSSPARTWKITNKSSRTLTSSAPLWRSPSSGCTSGRAPRRGWMWESLSTNRCSTLLKILFPVSVSLIFYDVCL